MNEQKRFSRRDLLNASTGLAAASLAVAAPGAPAPQSEPVGPLPNLPRAASAA